MNLSWPDARKLDEDEPGLLSDFVVLILRAKHKVVLQFLDVALEDTFGVLPHHNQDVVCYLATDIHYL